MLIPKKNRKEVYKYLFKGEHSPELLIVGADIITVDRMCRAMTMHGSPPIILIAFAPSPLPE